MYAHCKIRNLYIFSNMKNVAREIEDLKPHPSSCVLAVWISVEGDVNY